jgi:hypothetical protein
MTTGAVIFAQNTPEVDYVKLAIFAASRINKYLGIPVSLLTDSRRWLEKTYPDHGFDQVIDIPVVLKDQSRVFFDGSLASSFSPWKNLTRNMVYDLSPYDKTLVIDSDYIINSDILKFALDSDYDLQIYKGGIDLADWRSIAEFTRINQYSVPFYWATVFVFQKNTTMDAFFNLIEYIRNNWIYFRTLYNISSSTFRNDFAFSIAIHIMNGKTNGEFATNLPGSMVFIKDKDYLVDINDSTVKCLVEKKDFQGEYILTKTTGLDIHVMNKYSLSRFIDGGSGV